jgi:hypothetical protein
MWLHAHQARRLVLRGGGEDRDGVDAQPDPRLDIDEEEYESSESELCAPPQLDFLVNEMRAESGYADR